MQAQVNAPAPVVGRLQRARRSTLDIMEADFVIYPQEADFDIGDITYPITFKQAMEGEFSEHWEKAMIAELESMKINKVWTLV